VAAEDSGQDPIGGNGPDDARLASLDARLKAASAAERARTTTAQRAPDKGYRQGSRVLAELIAGPAGGALLGWLIDRLFGTAPWGLLVMMILGIAVAFRNIIKISGERPE
jgi:ATP synthase protein I